MTSVSEDTPHKNAELDEFATLLLDTLYALSPYAKTGLMPVSLREKPSSYEKYPQELFTLLEGARASSSGVENAFVTWRSRLLRKLDYLDVSPDAYFQHLERIHGWMSAHDRLFDRANLRHLRNSMFGRTYAYLYPRLSLIMEFADEGAVHGLLEQTVADGKRLCAVADPAFIAEHFAAHTKTTQERIRESLGEDQVGVYLQAAQTFLIEQQAYFNQVFRNKAPKSQPGVPQQSTVEG